MSFISGYPPGKHLLLDFWGMDASLLEDESRISTVLREAAEVCGATVLDIRLHHFGEGQGVTGVALLAESHISIHTWPEEGFAALDVFMCGNCDARLAIEPLRKTFQPERQKISEYLRGEVERHNMS